MYSYPYFPVNRSICLSWSASLPQFTHDPFWYNLLFTWQKICREVAQHLIRHWKYVNPNQTIEFNMLSCVQFAVFDLTNWLDNTRQFDIFIFSAEIQRIGSFRRSGNSIFYTYWNGIHSKNHFLIIGKKLFPENFLKISTNFLEKVRRKDIFLF